MNSYVTILVSVFAYTSLPFFVQPFFFFFASFLRTFSRKDFLNIFLPSAHTNITPRRTVSEEVTVHITYFYYSAKRCALCGNILQVVYSPDRMDTEYNVLIREYWFLRHEVSTEEGRLVAFQKVLLLLHYYIWGMQENK